MYVQYVLIIFSPMGQRQQSPPTEEQLGIVAGWGRGVTAGRLAML